MAVLAATVFMIPGAAADSHPGQTAIGLTLRGNVVDTDVHNTSRTNLEQVDKIVVYEAGGKRFAATSSSNEGVHLVDITDVASIKPMPQPWTNAPALPAQGAEGIDTWVANDGNRYFAAVWRSSEALQIYGLNSNGLLWAAWSTSKNGDKRRYIIDDGRMRDPSDVFVYTLQTGTCQTASGCEVFPGVSVNQGDPIYKNYAVVSSYVSDSVQIYDVTDPTALCNCNSGSGQTALLRGRIADSGSLELDGAYDVEYYQQGSKHYALVSSQVDSGIQIIDITDPSNPVARDYLSDTGSLYLRSAEDSAVYTVNGRYYAVVAAGTDDGIQIVDITDPTDITAVSGLGDNSARRLEGPRGVTVHSLGNRRYAVVASQDDDGIQIVDVTDPATPVAKANIGHATGRVLDGAFDVDTFEVSGRHYAIVAAALSNGLQIVELTEVFAEAGNDQEVPRGQTTVLLDGRGSSVSSGATPTYKWTQTGGPTVSFISTTNPTATFIPPSVNADLTFRLTVTAAGVSATDTVRVTVEGSGNSVDSYGGRITGGELETEEVNKPDGGTATWIGMHFTGSNQTQSITYSLLEEPASTATVDVMTMVQNAPYGAPGYAWSWNAVSVSPKRLTFTTSNWSEPQTINITSNGNSGREQVILVFVSTIPGQYSGIHVTVR